MNFLKKWYTYQKERFPILTLGLYFFCIVFGVFCYCISNVTVISANMLTGDYIKCSNKELFVKWAWLILPLFAVTFLQFLLVRIIDEFKDYEEDCKYRSYRPVPRGLITLKELKVLFLICTILQVGITYLVNGLTSLAFLSVVWVFFFLMTKNFFIKDILDKHIVLEVLLDELMMPILVLFLASFIYYIDFNVLKYLLILSYFISCIVEIARKIRCREDEEDGVRTYTAVLGIPKATAILTIFETLVTLLLYTILGRVYLLPIIIVYIILTLINILFMIEQRKKYAKAVEISSNIFILIAYLSMGLLLL